MWFLEISKLEKFTEMKIHRLISLIFLSTLKHVIKKRNFNREEIISVLCSTNQ